MYTSIYPKSRTAIRPKLRNVLDRSVPSYDESMVTRLPPGPKEREQWLNVYDAVPIALPEDEDNR